MPPVAVGLCIFIVLVAAPVLAQIAPGVPRPAIGTREQIDLGTRLPEVAPNREGPVAETPGPTPDPTVADPAPGFTFLLNGITVINSTIYQPEDFEPLFADLIGTQVTLAQLRAVADAIEARYRDDGYLATRAIIPPQAIAGGVPTIEVYEGTVIFYEVRGEVGPAKVQIERLLDNLITGEPARWSDLERYLLLARDLPGISLTGTLRAAGDTAPGGVILIVDAALKAYDGFVNAANRSAQSTGPYTLTAGGALNSFTEAAPRLGVVGLTTSDWLEQLSGFMSYEQSLGSDGLIVRASGSRSFSEPGRPLAEADLTSEATVVTFLGEYPIRRARVFSLWSRAGFEVIEQHIKIGGNEANNEDDQLRVLFAGLRGIWQAPVLSSTLQFDMEVRQGLEQFGASKVSSQRRTRDDAEPDYTIVRGSVAVTQPIIPQIEVYGFALAQHASVPVSSFEELSLGELTVGRGYEPGSLTGESGFGLTGEIRFKNEHLVPPDLDEFVQEVTPYAFVDYGRVYDRNSILGEDFQDLMSWGFGIRIRALENLLADFYYVQPTTAALSTAERIPNAAVRFNVTKFF